jgi:hypothetical protein
MKFGIKNLGTAISGKLSLAGLKIKAHSPAILVGVGIVGLVTAGVMACKATPKAMKVKETCKEQIDAVKEALVEEKEVEGKPYSEQDAKKDTRLIYFQTLGRYVKVYGPSVAIAAVSIVSILGGFKILHGRYVATAGTLAAVENKFASYRERVKGVVGEEKEDLIYKNAEKKLVTEETVNEETGEVEQHTYEKKVAKFDINDPFCFIFDVANAPNRWNVNKGYNLMFLTNTQDELNRMLQSRRYLTLNQALEALGMQPVDYGMTAGWLASDENASVQLNITAPGYEDDPGHYTGGSPDYLLFFNCRGNIQVGMPKKGERKKFGPKLINPRHF